MDDDDDDDDEEEKEKTSLAERVLAGLAVPFVAVAPGVAKAMDMESENANEIPAIYQESPSPIRTLKDVAQEWALENGVEVSWEETVEGIEMGIEALVDAKKRKDEKN
jgi:hypothetical protein